jgi:hypothetical protein
MPGATPYGCHEGSRSEYLAQYVFASWGTAVAIPHQEDHGVDLACTLMERVGKNYLAKSPYTAQVKSEFEPVVFKGEEAVRWVVEHPLPLFLCVVEKRLARLSVYHTFPRFYVWAYGQWPDRLEMTPEPPTPGKLGRCSEATTGDYCFSLGQPILSFTVPDMLDDDFWAKAKRAFTHWVNAENDNLTRIRMGLPKCRKPASYRTNDDGDVSWVETWLLFPDGRQFALATSRLKETLEWVAAQLYRGQDIGGVAKAALLHRHLFPDDRLGNPIYPVEQALNERLGETTRQHAGVDRLAAVLDAALTEQGKVE